MVSSFNYSVEDKEDGRSVLDGECNKEEVVSHWVRHRSDYCVSFHLSECHCENGRNRYGSSY
ncbi:hypothetical protein EMIT0194MI4_50370 [Pseudomonas sp. IT-194MI4]